METTRLLVEAAGLIVVRADLTIVYDERGARYELPKYIWSDPEDDEENLRPVAVGGAPAGVPAAAA